MFNKESLLPIIELAYKAIDFPSILSDEENIYIADDARAVLGGIYPIVFSVHVAPSMEEDDWRVELTNQAIPIIKWLSQKNCMFWHMNTAVIKTSYMITATGWLYFKIVKE
jgi:hypothetical protein